MTHRLTLVHSSTWFSRLRSVVAEQIHCAGPPCSWVWVNWLHAGWSLQICEFPGMCVLGTLSSWFFSDDAKDLDFDLTLVGIRKAGCTVISAGDGNTMVMIWAALMAWNTGEMSSLARGIFPF